MSTRCIINFCSGGEIIAKVYRHCDGYPCPINGVDSSLEDFFNAVQEECFDTRFDDPSYLAAKFVVWQAGKYANKPGSLNFLSVGVLMEDPSDIQYRWFVDCDSSSKPQFRFEEC